MASCQFKSKMSDKEEKFPFDINEIDKQTKKMIFEMSGEELKDVLIGPKKYCLPNHFPENWNKFYNIDVRKDDVLIFGLPRCGTTLTQEMVWLIGNDLDYDTASNVVLDYRFPSLDYGIFFHKTLSSRISDGGRLATIKQKYDEVHENLKTIQGTRYIKTHVPLSLMPKLSKTGCKIIYCARNPKDVSVSLYHVRNFVQNKDPDPNGFPIYWKKFKHNLIGFGPYFEHVKEGWARRNDENFLFMFFEDVVKDKRSAMKRIAKFLNKTLSETDLDRLEDHLSIDKFRQNNSVNNSHLFNENMAKNKQDQQFIRQGQTGGWNKYFTNELNDEADQWIKDNLKGTDLIFPQ